MNAAWARSRLPVETTQEEREAIIRASSKGFALMASLLQDQLASIQRERLEKAGYDTPNWAYYQADLAGQERRVRLMLDILKDVCYTV